MAASATTTTLQRSSTSSTLFCLAVIIALTANLILSVDAIRCHQCNSRHEEDCHTLRLNTPRAPLDEQYLKDCEGDNSGIAFCRKTVTKIEVNQETRVVRSCGWIKGSEYNNSCISADNEGYDQIICVCHGDGCNGANSMLSGKGQLFMWSLAATGMLLSSALRR